MKNNQTSEQGSYSVWRQSILPSLTLFTSLGTILCCALPALLVSLGLGASLAGLIGAAPWLTAISDYKITIFTGAGMLILAAGFMQWRARHAPCPADPLKAKACMRLRKISWVILGLSAVIYLTGFFFAFLAADIFYGE